MQKDKKNYKLRKFGPITERRDYSITKHSLPVGDILATSKKKLSRFYQQKNWRTFKWNLSNWSFK